MPVTCYICGRDFGTRSIGIHLPNCQKKWEQEQEKLPKAQRRELPAPPPDFDKVLSGEIKGKALAKVNQQAFEEYNNEALVPCSYCARTFLPKSLDAHHKLCTADKPMLKQEKGKTYTGQAKAKVNYPMLKSSKNKDKLTTASAGGGGSASEKSATTAVTGELTLKSPATAEPALKSTGTDEPALKSLPSTHLSPPPRVAVPQGLPPLGRPRPGTTSANSSRQPSPAASRTSQPAGSGTASPHPPAVEAPERELVGRRDESPMSQSPVDTSRDSSDESSADSSNRSSLVEENSLDYSNSPIQNVPARREKQPTSQSRVQSAVLRKRDTFVCNPSYKAETVPRERLVALITDIDLFDEEEHRREVYHMLTTYIREVRTRHIRELLHNPVFDDAETSQEAAEILEEFIKLKTNNNAMV